tara:strand:- start:2204 stop:2974 length:771 start_codon:yes stop_codon:yes gene_type:complete
MNKSKKVKIIIVVLVVLVVSVFFIRFCKDTFWWEKKIILGGKWYPNISFPKIIHQTWKTMDLNKEQQIVSDSWKNMYKGYEYILWTDESIENFVHTNFYWYLPTWNRLDPFIKKIDCIRYMWMYVYGGIYSDIDMKCLKHFDFEHKDYHGAAFIPATNTRVNWRKDANTASPALLASYPRHDFWLHMLEYISQNYERPVLKATGPCGLGNSLVSYMKKDYDDRQTVVLLNETKFGLGFCKRLAYKYAYHYEAGTWL